MTEFLGENQPALSGPYWADAASSVGVSELEAKALYVIGLRRHLAEAAGKCVTEPDVFWLPALGLIADAADLIGRCRRGDAKGEGSNRKRLDSGFEALLHPDYDLKTPTHTWTVDDLRGLRNFALHGTGTPAGGELFSPQLVHLLLAGLAEETTRYWQSLTQPDADAQQRLAKADIAPVYVGGEVVHLAGVLDHIRNGKAVGGDLLYESEWRGKTS